MAFSSHVTERLAGIVGTAAVLTQAEDLIPYSFDGTAALKERPEAVVFPHTTDEVARCVEVAAALHFPIVTRGSGTGLSGGSVPSKGSLVLCLAQMDAILDVDPHNLTLRAQAGAITLKIDEAAGQHGLFYPPDPGSMRISTIGGNVAENSGGLRGLKYGVTRDYVMGLEVVLADGQVTRLGSQCVKDVAGYSMKDLFIGSEGTLGIITEILLKIVPRPAARSTMLAVFERIEDAAETVSAIIAAKIIPCTLEFLDRMTTMCVEDYAHVGLPTDCAAVLLMETDGHPAAVADEAERMAAIARAHGARQVRTAADAAEALALSTARRSAFSALARRRPTTILEDVTVPRSQLATMVTFIAGTAQRLNLEVGTFGHMGDGNLHPTFLTDERDADEMHRVHEALDAIVQKTIEVGGTITGEHGVGLAKKRWLRQQMGDRGFMLMRQVKQALDPNGLLNPGKISADAVADTLQALDYSVLQQCMHCGLCLPTCPTYDETKLERNSPRGRISLMRAVADGDLDVSAPFAEEMSYCLGCLACQTACPAGVNYAELLETARSHIEHVGAHKGAMRRVWRAITLHGLFMHPRALRLVGRILRMYQRTGADVLVRRLGLTAVLPAHLGRLEPQTPRISAAFSSDLIAVEERPRGEARYRVALLTGCVQDLAFSDINRDTADALLANKCVVVTPPVQPCCGSLHAHNGELHLARVLARRMIDLFPPTGFDAIITNAGGCGSHLRHYAVLLAADQHYLERAHEWDRKVRDIHEWLEEIGCRAPTASPFDAPTTVTYHESCHLVHGQKVSRAPRAVLQMLPGVTLTDLPESSWCCGSAGIYAIAQPDQADKLLRRKVTHIAATGATTVATANPGCHLQIARGLRESGAAIEVSHPVSLLARAYRLEPASDVSRGTP